MIKVKTRKDIRKGQQALGYTKLNTRKCMKQKINQIKLNLTN